MTKGVLVIRGGIAGIQASLDLADAGYQSIWLKNHLQLAGEWLSWTRHFQPWTARFEFSALRPWMSVDIQELN